MVWFGAWAAKQNVTSLPAGLPLLPTCRRGRQAPSPSKTALPIQIVPLWKLRRSSPMGNMSPSLRGTVLRSGGTTDCGSRAERLYRMMHPFSATDPLTFPGFPADTPSGTRRSPSRNGGPVWAGRRGRFSPGFQDGKTGLRRPLHARISKGYGMRGRSPKGNRCAVRAVRPPEDAEAILECEREQQAGSVEPAMVESETLQSLSHLRG